ncbi:MAG: CDP-glycerol glycerophosphotransferase family protein [Chlamydiales bacterium]
MKNHAGLIYDDSRHYLDHLGPLCALLRWPLIVCEPALADLAAQFYPDLETIYIPLSDVKLPETIVSCDTRPLISAAFPGERPHHLWLPHGNSDKGTHSPLFEALSEEKVAFVYGQKIIDFMREKGVFPHPIRVGNFRWEYYMKHQSFYQRTIELPQGKNFLYAPTWDDAEGNNSFWSAFPPLASRLPKGCHLLVKLHPNTVRKYAPELEILMGRYAQQENIHFLPEYPPIYPLLSRCDGYIGDMSSIGYDFLKLNRPMFFLAAHPHFALHRCGQAIDPATFDYSLEKGRTPHAGDLYNYTFDPPVDWDLVRREIDALCCIQHRD